MVPLPVAQVVPVAVVVVEQEERPQCLEQQVVQHWVQVKMVEMVARHMQAVSVEH